MTTNKLSCLFVAFSVAGFPVFAQDVGDPSIITAAKAEYSPYLDYNYPDQVFFGDTHVHTSFSTDAGLFGNRLGPDQAYKFAKGETVLSSSGVRTRLLRPLDWLVISDHAENLSLAPMIEESAPALLKTQWGKQIHDLTKAGKLSDAFMMWGTEVVSGIDPLAGMDALTQTMWERLTSSAEDHNIPGQFSAIIGFEWTSAPDGNNLHRNVIFRDGKDLADRVLPFSVYDSADPEDLWKWMQAYEDETGGHMFAIPHNGNLSNGQMFDDVTLTTKQALTADQSC